MLNFITTENMCLLCDILISYRFLWIKFVCSFELLRVLSGSLNCDKENITLENNNVLETFADNSLNNMNCFKNY